MQEAFAFILRRRRPLAQALRSHRRFEEGGGGTHPPRRAILRAWDRHPPTAYVLSVQLTHGGKRTQSCRTACIAACLAAAMAHTSRLLERSGPNDHQIEAKRPPFRTHHGTALPPPVQALQMPSKRSVQPVQIGRNGRRLLRNGSIIADIIMSSSIALQACLGRCV